MFGKRLFWQCQRDMHQLAHHGYPWSPHSSAGNSSNNPTVPDRNTTLKDDLGVLNHVCHIHERSRTCLEESGIRDYCLTLTSYYGADIYTDFQFIVSIYRI